MLKLTILVLCLASLALSQNNNAISKDLIDARAQESAEWAAARLGPYVKLQGDYYLQKFSNLKSVVDKESTYTMSLDVLVADNSKNQQNFKVCDVEVIDDPIQNKRILKSAACRDNKSF